MTRRRTCFFKRPLPFSKPSAPVLRSTYHIFSHHFPALEHVTTVGAQARLRQVLPEFALHATGVDIIVAFSSKIT